MLVNGGLLTDLPLLNIGDTVNLAVGDVVVLMKMKSAWAIMGRIVVPGGAALNSSASVSFADLKTTGIIALTTSVVSYAPVTLAVPAWANRVALTATSTGLMTNGSPTARRYISVSVKVDGVSNIGGGFNTTWIAGAEDSYAMQTISIAKPVTPGGSVLIETEAFVSTAQNAFILTNSLATFYKV